MEDRSLYKVGGVCSILLGLSYVMVGITYLFDQVHTGTGGMDQFWRLFAQYPTMRLLNHFAFVLGAFFAMGAVPAISQIVREGNEGWVRWALNIAYLGIIVTAITHIQYLTLLPVNSRIYVNGDELTRKIFLAAPRTTMDSSGWFRYGCLGIWMLMVCLLARRDGRLPRSLMYLGFIGSLLYMMIPVIEGIDILELVAAVGGGLIVGPIWFIWIGASLYRMQVSRTSTVARKSEMILQGNVAEG